MPALVVPFFRFSSNIAINLETFTKSALCCWVTRFFKKWYRQLYFTLSLSSIPIYDLLKFIHFLLQFCLNRKPFYYNRKTQSMATAPFVPVLLYHIKLVSFYKMNWKLLFEESFFFHFKKVFDIPDGLKENYNGKIIS